MKLSTCATYMLNHICSVCVCVCVCVCLCVCVCVSTACTACMHVRDERKQYEGNICTDVLITPAMD